MPSGDDTHDPWTDSRREPTIRDVTRSEDILSKFGSRVRELRKASGVTQEGLAEACGLDRTYIGGIERGERNVSLRNIDLIARALGVPLSRLMKDL